MREERVRSGEKDKMLWGRAEGLEREEEAYTRKESEGEKEWGKQTNSQKVLKLSRRMRGRERRWVGKEIKNGKEESLLHGYFELDAMCHHLLPDLLYAGKP
jgi:hypothetical protein